MEYKDRGEVSSEWKRKKKRGREKAEKLPKTEMSRSSVNWKWENKVLRERYNAALEKKEKRKEKKRKEKKNWKRLKSPSWDRIKRLVSKKHTRA